MIGSETTNIKKIQKKSRIKHHEDEGGFSSGNLSYSENEDGVSIID